MQRPSFADMDCSIAQTLEVVGEWWSLMVVREVFFGRRRFEEMHADLGIARNTLTNRLTRLVEEGILERRSYSESGRRAEYHLTPAGRDLYRVFVAMMEWGDRWRPRPDGPSTVMVHACGQQTTPTLVCDHCGEPVTTETLRMRPSPSRADDETHPLVRARAEKTTGSA